MDSTILSEYSSIKVEIKDLRRRIDNDLEALDKLNKSTVKDSVACGKKGKKPIRTVKVEGRPTKAIKDRRSLYEYRIDKLEKQEQKLLEMKKQIEEYIASISKSEIRIMFRLYYIDDLSWIQVAHRMNDMFPSRTYTEDSCRMKHKRFLENA